MLLNEIEIFELRADELASVAGVEIFELRADELASVAGGPEVANDPGHG
jgi:hypothetical protein